jgi:hypothetical protein
VGYRRNRPKALSSIPNKLIAQEFTEADILQIVQMNRRIGEIEKGALAFLAVDRRKRSVGHVVDRCYKAAARSPKWSQGVKHAHFLYMRGAIFFAQVGPKGRGG